jgi:hypothetical protein
MNTQLNIPLPSLLLPNPTHLATIFRKRFDQEIEQNIDSLARKKVVFDRNYSELHPITGWDSHSPTLVSKPIIASTNIKTIAGIDSSCIHIAETDEGSIYAGRAAVVFSQGGRLISYVRIGPIIYYINETSASKISMEISDSNRLLRLLLSDRSFAQRMIRERLERGISLELAATLSGSIILLDGCFKASQFEARNRSLHRLLDIANQHDDVVIGLSKTTKVKLLNLISTALYSASDLPAYLDVDEMVSPFIRRVEGQIVLARFSNDGHVYRVDVAYSDKVEDALSQLISNDHFYHGYPETLRLAHHLSIFTPAQNNSVKSFLVKHAGVVAIPSEDVRHVSLGTLSV